MEFKSWLNETFAKTEKKLEATCKRVGDKIPYIPTDGRYTDHGAPNISSWTNGFWGGIMWQLYHATKNKIYRQSAENLEKRLDNAFDNYVGLHHDVGFMYLHTAVANHRLTGNEQSFKRGLHAANLLAGRYNPSGDFIVAWNVESKGWMIIDTMMNLPLLYWADQALGRPHYSYIANRHADKAIEKLIRPDGSCNHIVVLDHHTGETLEVPGGQGYDTGSSWSRGQAWAIYGFSLCYHYTKQQRYLDAAKRVAHYFIANIAKTDYIPLCDFRAPKAPVIFDTTAGNIAMCGLLSIAEQVTELEKDFYEDAAISILKSMVAGNTDFNLDTDGVTINGTTAYHHNKGNHKGHKHHVPVIYGDYFFVEGLLRLMGKSFLIW